MKNYQVETGETALFSVQAPDTSYTTLGCRGVIYNSAGSIVVSAFNYTHAANGLYLYNWTDSLGEGNYVLQNLFYTDGTYVTLADVIQPDADGVVIGHFRYRPSFGGTDYTTTIAKEFTEEELKRLVKLLLEVLVPILAKKSEFDPLKDAVLVKNDGIKNLESFIVKRLNVLEQNIPKQDVVVAKIEKESAILSKLINSLISGVNSEIGKINNNDVVETLTKVVQVVELRFKMLTDNISEGFSNNTGIEKLENEIVSVKELITGIDVSQPIKDQTENIDVKLQEINNTISILADNAEIEKSLSYIYDCLKTLETKNNDREFLKIEVQLGKLLNQLRTTEELLQNKLIEKDGLDDQRVKYLIEIIQAAINQLATATNNTELKQGVDYLLNNLQPVDNEI